MNFLFAYGRIIREERFMYKIVLLLVLCIFLTPITRADECGQTSENNLFAPTEFTPSVSVLTNKTNNNCAQLVEKMFNERATTYNVLNLTPQQKTCKDDIEKRRYQEIDIKINVLEQELYVLDKLKCNPQANKDAINKQKKIIKNVKKDIDETMQKYDKEFKTMLSGEQKAKYNLIQRMKRKDLKKCEHNKKLFKQDAHLQPFGQPYFYDENACPKHGVKHPLNHKCKLLK